jgi:hypothetical protein
MWAVLQSNVLERLPPQMRNGVAQSEPVADKSAEGWKRCIDALLDIRLLEDNWDGQGSPAPAHEIVDSALILAVLLRQKHVEPPQVTVQSVQGTVLMEWQWADTTTFEIDVIEPYVADVFLMVPGAEEAEYWQLRGAGATNRVDEAAGAGR